MAAQFFDNYELLEEVQYQQQKLSNLTKNMFLIASVQLLRIYEKKNYLLRKIAFLTSEYTALKRRYVEVETECIRLMEEWDEQVPNGKFFKLIIYLST